MKIKCVVCKEDYNVKPYHLRKVNTCSKECKTLLNYIDVECSCCGKSFKRLKCIKNATGNYFCEAECSNKWKSIRLTKMNLELNPDRMVYSTRLKLRKHHLGLGEGKTYTKIFGVHEHRVVASQKLGRDLLAGEIVHHIDENKRNNAPENLHVFPNQKEHAKWHLLFKKNPELEFDKYVLNGYESC